MKTKNQMKTDEKRLMVINDFIHEGGAHGKIKIEWGSTVEVLQKSGDRTIVRIWTPDDRHISLPLRAAEMELNVKEFTREEWQRYEDAHWNAEYKKLLGDGANVETFKGFSVITKK